MITVLKSKLTIARIDSSSVRTTVPQGVVSALKLEVGKEIEWEIEVRDGELIAIVKKT